jgi:hypothetical protein
MQTWKAAHKKQVNEPDSKGIAHAERSLRLGRGLGIATFCSSNPEPRFLPVAIWDLYSVIIQLLSACCLYLRLRRVSDYVIRLILRSASTPLLIDSTTNMTAPLPMGDFVYSSFWCIAKVSYIYDTIDTHPLHSGESKNVFTFGLFLTASTNFTSLGWFFNSFISPLPNSSS